VQPNLWAMRSWATSIPASYSGSRLRHSYSVGQYSIFLHFSQFRFQLRNRTLAFKKIKRFHPEIFYRVRVCFTATPSLKTNLGAIFIGTHSARQAVRFVDGHIITILGT